MDARQLAIFTADVRFQMQLIRQVVAVLEARSQGLEPSDAVRLESVTYQIHNFYNAVEDLLRLVATQFENQIADTARWHQLILQRMTHEIPAIRPALLSQSSFEALKRRSFKYRFWGSFLTHLRPV